MSSGHFNGCASVSFTECWCEVRRYAYVACIIVGVFATEVIGGKAFGSLALFADSAHIALDGVAALISVFVALRARRHADVLRLRKRWMRVSALLLLASLAWIAAEALERLFHPQAVLGWGMFATAALGGLGNLWQNRVLHGGHDTLTARAQKIHVEGDLWSSAAVLAGGAVIGVTSWSMIDPLLSLCVVAFIALRTIHLLRGHGHEH